jgi:hypothetical protein
MRAGGGKIGGMKWIKLILIGCIATGFAANFADHPNIVDGVYLFAAIALLGLLVRDAVKSK